MGYLANFMVYTFAMVGIIVVALLIFKQATSGTIARKSRNLRVVDTLSIGPRKNLYIITTGTEQFLIAADFDKTTLISKLENNIPENISQLSANNQHFKPEKTFLDEENIPNAFSQDRRNITNRQMNMKNVLESMRKGG